MRARGSARVASTTASVARSATMLLIAAAIVGEPTSLPRRPLMYDCNEIAPPARIVATTARGGLANSAAAARGRCSTATAP
jgi:hypothetical protein